MKIRRKAYEAEKNGVVMKRTKRGWGVGGQLVGGECVV